MGRKMEEGRTIGRLVADRRTVVTGLGGLAASALLGTAHAQAANPLSLPWSGRFGGLPPFGAVRTEHFVPGFQAAMAAQKAEIAAIVANKAPASFANTLLALERSGGALDRAQRIYGVFTSLVSTPELRDVQKLVDPLLASHSDEIVQNAALFARIDRVYRDRFRLKPAEQRLAWRWWSDFVQAGAQLPPAQKARVAQINTRMATLHGQFQDNLLADETLFTELTEAQMDGLPDAVKAAFRAEARSRNVSAAGLVPNRGGSVTPFLTSATDRAMRERVFKLFKARGDMGGASDNNAIVTEILKLRAERSRILGFTSYAHWRLVDTMAKTPENALGLMESVWRAAIKRVGEEVADMQKIADAEKAGVTIEPWDYSFYSEKVRVARFDLDLRQARPYLQLDKLREGMFWVAGELYGLTFSERSGVATVHPDIRVWEVKDRAGTHVAVWYFDPFARAGKRSGAWSAPYRVQDSFDGKVTAIGSNNSNFQKPAPGEPLLIEWNAAVTLFHEFGHSVHGMLQNIPYSSLARVPRDYGEFPSQVKEHWLTTEQVLGRFCLHHQTGEPMPKDLIAKIKAAEKFNQGYAMVGLISTALMDMKLHMAGEDAIDPDRFERETLAALNMPPQATMYHRIPQSYHFFSSEGYAAGYYGYLWSDALVADATEAFEAAPGGFYDRAIVQRFRDTILSKGNSIDPADQFRAFRGRDMDPAALMRKKGFA